jgi:hypothetical protein
MLALALIVALSLVATLVVAHGCASDRAEAMSRRAPR